MVLKKIKNVDDDIDQFEPEFMIQDLQKETENKAKIASDKAAKKVSDDKKKVIDDLFKAKPLTFLNDVPLLITAELSRTRITMKDFLNYKKGSIIQLEKLAGEPMDILINNEFMAKGEIVVVNNNYAVRLTDLIEKIEILNRKYNEDIKG